MYGTIVAALWSVCVGTMKGDKVKRDSSREWRRHTHTYIHTHTRVHHLSGESKSGWIKAACILPDERSVFPAGESERLVERELCSCTIEKGTTGLEEARASSTSDGIEFNTHAADRKERIRSLRRSDVSSSEKCNNYYYQVFP